MQTHTPKNFFVIDDDTFNEKLDFFFANLRVIQPIPVKKRNIVGCRRNHRIVDIVLLTDCKVTPKVK